jgi:hypothetical protein
MADQHSTVTSDLVDQTTAETPLDELTEEAGVREAFELYEAAAAAYAIATSHYGPVVATTSSTNAAPDTLVTG